MALSQHLIQVSTNCNRDKADSGRGHAFFLILNFIIVFHLLISEISITSSFLGVIHSIFHMVVGIDVHLMCGQFFAR